MSYYPVNIRVQDQNGRALPGVPVVIYTLDLQQHFSSLVSNEEGFAETILYAPSSYDVRAHVPAARTSRFRLDVTDTGPQQFTVTVPVQQPGDSLYPDMCRVHETFLTPNGRPMVGTVQARMVNAAVLRGALTVLSSPLPGVIGEGGRYSEEFPRRSRIQFQIPGMEQIVEVTIPDKASARLMDLLAPYLTKIRFLEPLPETISSGTRVEVPFELTRSDEKVTTAGYAPLEVQVSGPLTVSTNEHTLVLLAGEAGTAEVVLSERMYPELPDCPRINRQLPLENGSFEIQVG